MSLAKSKADHYFEQGFSSLPDFVNEKELQALAQILSTYEGGEWAAAIKKLYSLPAQSNQSILFWKKLLPNEESKFLCSLVKKAAVLAASYWNISLDEVQVSFRIFYKPRFFGAEVKWHQDEAWHSPYITCQQLNIWIPLQDVNAKNGALHYLAGSHRGNLLEHVASIQRHQPLILSVKEKVIGSAICVPLQRGDAVVHHCRTLHMSYPNQTNQPRAAIAMVCQGPEKKCIATRQDWLSNKARYLNSNKL